MLEAVLQRLILGQLHHVEGVWVWRQNVGAMRDHRGRLVRFGLPGQADISGLVLQPSGRGVRLEIECKSDEGAQTPEQRVFEEQVRRFGGVYILARALEDVLEPVRRLRAGEWLL